LADQAVDLNLKLIKWRIAPTLDLDVIKNTRCLLLGAGTLGSYVARNLLGWGVRKITFVDSGTVSFSNPVRQPLFDFKDCLDGGAKKALRAAEMLEEIYPGVDSTGHDLLVPMAGHAMVDEAKTRENFEQLKSLIEDHDVIFLLMDTRESRWLPTVMGKAAGKLVMNAALGFDTFVVMRHGVKDPKNPGAEPGCYFCNDVVAPADSMSDRTLDQQCTVTRPGGAAIASALLVEIMVSVLQHKDKALAPAAVLRKDTADQRGDHPLGIVPHQIRGFLATFENLVINGKSYDCCSACSDKITNAYSEGGWDFVKRALTEKGYVEELSGLTEVCDAPCHEKQAGSILTESRFNGQQRKLQRTLSGMIQRGRLRMMKQS
jgi:ubiquitin-like modifier-activating enzyme ATG7